MRELKVTARVAAFPAGTVLALDAEQRRRRRHIVEPAEFDKGEAPKLDKGREAVRLTARAEFKAGERLGLIAPELEIRPAAVGLADVAELEELAAAKAAKPEPRQVAAPKTKAAGLVEDDRPAGPSAMESVGTIAPATERLV